MLRIVYIRRAVNIFHPIFCYKRFRLYRKSIYAGYIVHMFTIMMYIVGMYSVVAHTINGFSPSPSKADTCIGYFADFVVFDIDVCNKSGTDGYTSPIFVGYIGYQVIRYGLKRTQFSFVRRVVW